MHHLVRGHGSAIRGGRTSIEVSLEYNPPGGKAGELVNDSKTSKSGGRATAAARSWSAAASSATDGLLDVRPQLVSGPPSFATPSLEQSDG